MSRPRRGAAALRRRRNRHMECLHEAATWPGATLAACAARRDYRAGGPGLRAQARRWQGVLETTARRVQAATAQRTA